MIGIAGKMASGKDTMAQFMIYHAASLPNSAHDEVPGLVVKRRAFADALKEEAAVALVHYYQPEKGYRYENLPQDIKDYIRDEERISSLAKRANMREDIKDYIRDEELKCMDDYLDIETLLAMMHDSRTKEHFRLMLQWWGTEFRRRQFGDDYWLRQLQEWIETENEIQYFEDQLVVLVPDVRFPNEADFIHQLGGFCIEITRPNDSTDQHPSETSLTGYDKFDICVNNDGDLAALAAVSGVLFNKAVRTVNERT